MCDVCLLTVWSVSVLTGRRLLQRLLSLVTSLGLVLESFLELPLCLFLFLQSLLDQGWKGTNVRKTQMFQASDTLVLQRFLIRRIALSLCLLKYSTIYSVYSVKANSEKIYFQ